MKKFIRTALLGAAIGLSGCGGEDPAEPLESKVIEPTKKFWVDFHTVENHGLATALNQAYAKKSGMDLNGASLLYFSEVLNADHKDGVTPQELKAFVDEGKTDPIKAWRQNVTPAAVTDKGFSYKKPAYAYDDKAGQDRMNKLIDRLAQVQKTDSNELWRMFAKEYVARNYNPPTITIDNSNMIYFDKAVIDRFAKRIAAWEGKK